MHLDAGTAVQSRPQALPPVNTPPHTENPLEVLYRCHFLKAPANTHSQNSLHNQLGVNYSKSSSKPSLTSSCTLVPQINHTGRSDTVASGFHVSHLFLILPRANTYICVPGLLPHSHYRLLLFLSELNCLILQQLHTMQSHPRPLLVLPKNR